MKNRIFGILLTAFIVVSAMSHYSSIVAQNNESAVDHVNQGNAYDLEYDFEQALVEYDLAIEIDPEFADAHYFRGQAHVNHWLANLERVSDPSDLDMTELEQAFADFERAIELNSADARYYTSRGERHAFNGDYDDAISDFEQALELDSEHGAAYIGLGDIYAGQDADDLATENYQHAVSVYTSMIETEPESAKIYTDRGDAYRRLGQLDDAIADYDQAIEIDSEYALAYAGRGGARISQAISEGTEKHCGGNIFLCSMDDLQEIANDYRPGFNDLCHYAKIAGDGSNKLIVFNTENIAAQSGFTCPR